MSVRRHLANLAFVTAAALIVSLTLNGGSKVASAENVTLTWATRASMPTARYRMGAAVASNGKVYVIGGGTLSNVMLGTVEEYDPATDTWRTRASMPTPRWDLGVTAATNGKIYAIGGWSDVPGLNAGVAVEEYDPATDTWATRANMPTNRYGLQAAGANNGKVYAIGAANGPGTPVEEYDPATNTWTSRADMPTGRGALAVTAAANGRIYAVGGRPRYAGGVRSGEQHLEEPDEHAHGVRHPRSSGSRRRRQALRHRRLER